jgi:UDP:flavonoid glycosyltransferase YjiC (YdhE family)
MERPCVLLCTANGVGLGHLSRMMAVGRALEHDVDVVIFTLSQAAQIPVDQGFHTEFLRSSEYGNVDGTEWNDFYAARLSGLIDFYRPTTVVFDGPHPYSGLCKTIVERPDIHWVWSRRGMWKRDIGHTAISRARLFSLIIEPGEYAESYDEGLTASRRHEVLPVGPVTFGSRETVIDGAAARAELGLDPDRPAALVQLGAGQINDVASLSGQVVDALRRHDIQIAVAESVLVRDPVTLPSDVIRVRRYPLAWYTDAFDLSFMASGYNSFHEALALELPTLFIPNTHTKMDDQSARARFAVEHGVALAWSDTGGEPLDAAVERLADASERARLRAAMRTLPVADGAEGAAATLRLWAHV